MKVRALEREQVLTRDLSARERALAKGKDAAVVAVAATGLATAITGMRFARSAPDGAVPLEDGNTPDKLGEDGLTAELRRKLRGPGG